MTIEQKECVLHGIATTSYWLTKDEDGSVYLHMFYEPYKKEDVWVNDRNLYTCINSVDYDGEDFFPELSWSDEKPYKIESIDEILTCVKDTK